MMRWVSERGVVIGVKVAPECTDASASPLEALRRTFVDPLRGRYGARIAGIDACIAYQDIKGLFAPPSAFWRDGMGMMRWAL